MRASAATEIVLYKTFDHGVLPFWSTEIIYFFVLLLTYDWRYARNWLSLRMEQVMERWN